MALADNETALQVLVVEDSPGDRRLLQEMLNDASNDNHPLAPAFRLEQAGELSKALDHLKQRQFDVLLLDLNLPDSQGLATFNRIKEALTDTAIVVLTGLADNTLAVEAIRHGAQDYLIKDNLDGNVLVRSLCYAVERQRLQTALEQARQQQYRQQEISSLEEISKASPEQQASVQHLLQDYTLLVQQHVRATRLREARPSQQVRVMAQHLVRLQARARDLAQLHLRMLKNTGSWSKASEERAFANDARLVLLELMGNLIDLYQDGATLRASHE